MKPILLAALIGNAGAVDYSPIPPPGSIPTTIFYRVWVPREEGCSSTEDVSHEYVWRDGLILTGAVSTWRSNPTRWTRYWWDDGLRSDDPDDNYGVYP